ncbi:MAG: ThuA domain-containing protein, partial [Planctomycetes bacterium]|nr:ThuA domain-containing protein [Planctomycetota bacterium]
VVAENEYKTETTLPVFAATQLGKHFRVSYVFGNDAERNDLPGISEVDNADVLLVSVRRRVLKPEAMASIKRFVEAGKPVIGIRTASHAFSLRGKKPPEGFVAWEDFDARVFGGNYHGHRGNKLKSTVRTVADAAKHPILVGVPSKPFPHGGSLYQTSPLAKNTTVLAVGKVEGHPEEPIAWTFRRADGGRSFYTSMGHVDDFKNEAFVRLFVNGIHWAAGLSSPKDVSLDVNKQAFKQN